MKSFTKKPKYGNTKVVVDDIVFDSKREYQRYEFLKLMEHGGIVRDLKRQVKYELIPKITHIETVHMKTKDKQVERVDQLPITYTCDFEYVIVETGELITEDVKISKQMIPKEFSLKAKLFFWKTGRKISLVFKPKQDVKNPQI